MHYVIPNFKGNPIDSTEKKSYNEIFYESSSLADELNRKILSDLFIGYLSIKNSLAEENTVQVQMQAAQLLDQLEKKLPDMDKNMIGDFQVMTDNISLLRSRISKASTIEDQRAIFNQINAGVIEYIKSYGLYDRTVYLIECDNSIFGKNFWLSDSMTDYRNPYTGAVGTDCWNVKESWTFR